MPEQDPFDDVNKELSDPEPLAAPELERVGAGYRLYFPQSRVLIEVQRVFWHREDAVAVYAISVVPISAADRPRRIDHGTLNLQSSRVRSSLAKELQPRHEAPWKEILDEASAKIIELETMGEDPVELTSVDVASLPPRQLLGNICVDHEPTMLFGHGGDGKSYLLLAAGISLVTGEALLDIQPRRVLKGVAYLDWEWRKEAHAERMHMLVGDRPIPGLWHFVCRKPLYQEVDRLSVQFRRLGIEYALIDSVAWACGGAPEESAMATAFQNALRVLDVGSLSGAHVNRKADTTMPFGCYSEDTEVLTRRGWLRHPELRDSDEVLCFDPETSVNHWMRPTHFHQHDYEGLMYRFASPSTDVLVTPEHRMLVKGIVNHSSPMRIEPDWRFVAAEDFTGRMYVTPYGTPLAEDRDDEPMADDRVRLIGWYVSEGSIDAHGGSLQLAQAQSPLAEEMTEALGGLGIDFGLSLVTPSEPGWLPMVYIRTRGDRDLAQWHADHCGTEAAYKKLPELTWDLSRRQKRLLMEALLDGDGCRRLYGGCDYTTVSPRLADDVQRLAIELGHPAAIRSEPAAAPGQLPRYVILIRPTTRRALTLRRHRHQSVEWYGGKVYCLSVPTGAYVTRRNGKMAIQGNSVFWHASMRGTYFVKKQLAEGGEDVLSLILLNRKGNSHRLDRQIAFTMAFSGQGKDARTTIVKTGTDALPPELRSHFPLKERLIDALRGGPLTVVELAAKVGSSEGSVRDKVNQFKGRVFQVLRPEAGQGRSGRIALTERSTMPELPRSTTSSENEDDSSRGGAPAHDKTSLRNEDNDSPTREKERSTTSGSDETPPHPSDGGDTSSLDREKEGGDGSTSGVAGPPPEWQCANCGFDEYQPVDGGRLCLSCEKLTPL